MTRVHELAGQVANLQTEIAAVEALIVAEGPSAPARPNVGWQPSREPQPWLTARSA